MTRAVASRVASSFGHHAGSIWEDLVRAAAPRMDIGGAEWREVGRWWGTGLDGKPMEIDVVGASADGRTVPVAEIERKAANLPLAKGRKIIPALFVKKTPSRGHGAHIYGPRQVRVALP